MTPLESGNGFCEILEATAICQHESKGVSKAKKRNKCVGWQGIIIVWIRYIISYSGICNAI